MREDGLRQMWQQNRAAVNAWLTIPSPWTAEIFAHAGFDAITIDTQHGLIDFQTALSMLQALPGGDATPLARVAWNEPSAVMRLLDAGVAGIICPMINTRAEAESFVGACRYPPQGYRSFGPTRAGMVMGDDYFERANETVITLAMIETSQALENVEEIAATPGLTGLYIGTKDLSLSQGLSDLGSLTQPALRDAVDRILAAADRNQLVAGIHSTSADETLNLSRQGFRLITTSNDTAALRAAARPHRVDAVR